MRAASLSDTKTISSRWTWYGNVFSSVVIKLSGDAVLLEFETISNCWTWYGTDISFPFLSSNYQSCGVIRIWNKIKLLDLVWEYFFPFCHPTIRVTLWLDFETISSCWIWYGTGFFLYFQPHSTMRAASLSDTKTISICWTWYGTDISFPFLSPHYQSHRVIGFWNNIMLLELVWHWSFLFF